MTKTLMIRISPLLHRKLKIRCVEHDETIAEYVRRVVEAALDQENNSERNQP